MNKTLTAIPTSALEVKHLEPASGGNVLPLVMGSDPILRTKSEQYNFVDEDQEARNQLVLDLGATMRYYAGIGLSAIQVGIPKRVFVLDIGEELPLAFFNPVIIAHGEDVELDEGCLSFPQTYVKVSRPVTIKVRFKNLNNEVVTHQFDGVTARAIQHEMDHLDGIVMKDRVSKLKWEQALNRKKKLRV